MFWLYRFNKSYKVVSLGKSEFLAQPVASYLHALLGDAHQRGNIFRRKSESEQRSKALFLLGKVRKVLRELGAEVLMQSLCLRIEVLGIHISFV